MICRSESTMKLVFIVFDIKNARYAGVYFIKDDDMYFHYDTSNLPTTYFNSSEMSKMILKVAIEHPGVKIFKYAKEVSSVP